MSSEVFNLKKGISRPGADEFRQGRYRLAQVALASFALAFLACLSLPPRCYTVDLQVEYLTACALRDGLDLFTPLTDLSSLYFPVTTTNFPHPNPHLPILSLICLPLTLLPFPVLVPLWLAFNIVVLIAVGRRLGLSLLGSLALAAWPPLWFMLFIGQYELLVLIFLLFGWQAGRESRDWQAGFWLGLAAVVKLYPALLLLPYLIRHRYRVVSAAGLVIALGQLGSLAVVGPAGFVRYYREVLPEVTGGYVRTGLNSSPYGALLRIFGGATDVDPLVNLPVIVLPVSIILSTIAIVGLAKMRPEAGPVALLVALPSVWWYQVILALPILVSLLREASIRRWALLATAAASLVLPLVNLSSKALPPLLQSVGVRTATVACLMSVIQTIGFLWLLILTFKLYRRKTDDARI